MKIGIDVDGVLLDYEKEMLANAEIFDIEQCRNTGIIESSEFFLQNRYDWTQEEKTRFINENFVRISKESAIMAGAKYVTDRLKEMGHELIIILARGIEGDEMIDIVMKKFAEYKFAFDKYYWKVHDKLEICQKEKIDMMIDDNTKICEKLVKHQIKTIYFRGMRGYDLEENEYLKEVSNWGEVYRYIKNLK